MKTLILLGLFSLISLFVRGQNINKAEYYLDSDPGIGLATPITISSPADSVNFSFNVPLNFSGKGFHKLFVRTRNANGKWSLNETRSIYVFDNSALVPPGNLVSFEYFIDHDPGPGAGTKGTITDTSNINFNIPTTGLDPGFHKIGVRVFNSEHIWSTTETRVVYILPELHSILGNKLAGGEYFIDNDPGIGNANEISDIISADSVSIDFTKSVEDLNPGFHKLSVRFRDSSGVWGMQDVRVFYIDSSKQFVSDPIVEAEYYLDTDPGLGMATQVTPLDKGDSVSFQFSIMASSLSMGDHKLVVRVKDSTNEWSIPEARNFTIADSTSHTAVNLVNVNNSGLLLYPNPVSDMLNVRLDLEKSSFADIEIYDFTGRVVRQTYLENLPAGFNQVSLNTGDFNAGLYLLRLQTLNGSQSVYFIKK